MSRVLPDTVSNGGAFYVYRVPTTTSDMAGLAAMDSASIRCFFSRRVQQQLRGSDG